MRASMLNTLGNEWREVSLFSVVSSKISVGFSNAILSFQWT